MKLVMVTPYFYPKVGGMENYALQIARGLSVQFGWEVIIITSNHQNTGDIEDKVENLRVIRLQRSLKLSNTPIGLSWYHKIEWYLNKIKPDILNAHIPVPFIGDVAIRVARRARIPTVLTYHNDLHKENALLKMVMKAYYLCLGNQTLKLANRIIVTTQSYAERSPILQQVLEKIEVIPPGVNPNNLIKKNTNVPPYVLFVGQLDKTHRHKGLEYLIRAIAHLNKTRSKVQLFAIGRGDDIERYQKLARELCIQDEVHFPGYVGDADIGEYFANATCLCLPSITESEGFGMVVLEAAMQMTPSIGSRIGGIPSAIEDGVTGFLVEPRSVTDLAEKIDLLSNNLNLRHKLGEAAYQRTVERFLWKTQIEKTHKLFNQLKK